MASNKFANSKNANMIKKIQQKSMAQTEGLVAKNIPLDQIDENPKNDKIYNMKGVESLMKGIEADGYLQAIGVFQKSDGRYEIFTGHRRFRAMVKLKEEGKLANPVIPCVVFAMPDDEDDKTLKLISTNIRNRPDEPMDMARAIYEYEQIRKKRKDYTGKLRDVVADYFGMGRTAVLRYEQLMRLIPELQELANMEGCYNIAVMCRASALSKEEQMELYKKIKRWEEEGIRELKERSAELAGEGEEPTEEELRTNSVSSTRIGQEITRMIEEKKQKESPAVSVKSSSKINSDEDNFIEEDAFTDLDGFQDVGDDDIETSDGNDPFGGFEDMSKISVSSKSLPADPIDRNVGVYTDELERIVEQENPVIKDREQLKGYLARLKKLVSVLEKMLKE